MDNSATKRSLPKSLFALTLGASYGLFCAGQAGALPGTPTIQNTGTPASNATFTSTATTLTVNQLVQNLAIVWTPSGTGSTPTKAFDILSGETVTFIQPATTSVAYNAISCSACSATQISGTLQSQLAGSPGTVGGRVWLFDPNGIVIGQGAVVNVGGLVASSLQGNITTWLASPNSALTLNDGGGATPTNGAVTNDGTITANNGVNGYVALIGNSVAATHTGATGSIDVGFGSINLAAGRVATITALNTGGLNFALSAAAGDAINVNNGTATGAVVNSGALTGAAVTLSANVANALFASAVNTSGVVRAVNLDNSGGTIKLVGAGSPVVASGTLNASGNAGTDPVGAVQITGDSVSLGATTVNGALTVEATTGGIAQTGAVAAGAATFTADTANQTIALATPTNGFSGAVSLNTAGTGTATIEAAALNLGTSNVGGTLSARSATGDITESGVLTAATGSSFTSAGNINLGTQANVLPAPTFTFTGTTGNLGLREVAPIAMPAITVHGSITLISDTGSITQGGAIAATAGTFTTSAANQTITLDNAANTFAGAVSLNTTGAAGNAAIVAAALNLGTSNVGGTLTGTATTGGITEGGAIAAGGGSFATQTANQSINLATQANNFTGPVSLNTTGTGGAAIESAALNFGASTVGGTLTGTATTGGITESGAITAGAGSFTTQTANQSINLATQANSFTGSVSLNTTGAAGNAAIEAAALNFGASTVGGTLTGTATTGAITEGAAITAGGGSFTTQAANQNITLSLANTFSGPVSLNTTGNASIEATALNFGASNVGGTLTGIATTGGITESGAITAGVGSFTTQTANQSINLATQANSFTGPVSLNTTGAGNASIEATALNFGASNVGGTLTGIATTGGITESGAITAGGGSFTTQTANQSINLATQANNFTGPVLLNTTGTGTASISSASLNLGTSNVGGTLTATATAVAPAAGITESGVLTAPTSSFISASNIDLSTQPNALPAPNFTFTGTTGNLGLREFGAIAMPAITVPGSITLISDTGSITQGGAIAATAGTFTTSAANQTITLGAANTFSGPVSLNTTGVTGNATIVAAALNFGASNVGGTLTGTATTGAITETGAIAAGGGSFTTQAANQTITLGAANTFSGPVSLNTTGATGNATIVATALNFGASTVGGALTGTATTGAITGSGAITAGGGSFTTQAANQSIDLAALANSFTGSVSLNTTGAAGNAAIYAAALNFGTSTVGGTLTGTATTGGITEGGAITAGGGSFITQAANQTITLGAANTFSGPVSLNTTGATGNATIVAAALNLGTSNVGGTLSATSTTGDITESGVLTAPTSSFTSAANIDLSTQANNLPGAAFAFTGTSGNLAFQNAGDVNLAATTVPGSITLISDAGSITQGGAIAATAGTFTTSAANQTITLGAANTFSGPVSLNTTGATGNATIVAAALNLGTSNVGGTLSATSTTGDITESGVLTAPTSSFTSAANIDLSTQANNLPGAAFAFGTSGNLAFQNAGDVNLAATTVPGSITLISDAGSITQGGAIAATAGTFTTSAANQTITLGAANTFSGPVSLNTTGTATIVAAALNLGTSNVGGALSATSTTGDITESGVLTAPTSSFTSAANIDLSTQANNLPGAAFAFGASGNLAFQNAGAINLAATTVPGSITLISDTGSITQGGAIAATAGTFTTSAANQTITLGAANTFSGPVSLNTAGAAGNATIIAAALNFGASNVGGTLTGTATTGGITESGAISAGGGSFTTQTANQSINLATQANNFTGPVSLNTTGAAAIDAVALNFGASNIGGTLTGIATTGGITESGAISAGGGSFTTQTANQSINLASQANNFTGPVSLDTTGTGAASISSASLNLGASSVGGTLTATSTAGDITESGVLDPTSSVFTSAGNINLGTQANVLGNVTFVFTGATGNLSFRDADGISMAATTVPGTITLVSDTGSITETGVISAASGTFTTSAANQGINLGTQANTFTGAVSFNTLSGGSAAVKGAALNLGASTVGGTLAATSATGSITESGVLTAAGGSVFTSAANIDLSTQANVLGGTVVAAAINGFVNVQATQFATVDAVAKNDITLNAANGGLDHLSALTFAGNVTAAAKGDMTVDGADAGLTSATGNVTLTAGGSISQVVAYNPTAAGVGLSSSDISIRGNTVTLNSPNLGAPGNFVGIIANNLTTANSIPGNLYFAVLTPSGQKIEPANLKINGLSALPVTPGVFLSAGNSLPQTEFNIGSPAYITFVDPYESGGSFGLDVSAVETSAEAGSSALNLGANSQQGTSSLNGILGSTPDANISLFNIVGVCLPADQRDDEEAAKHKDCLPAKTTDTRLPKLNPLSDALSPILVASRSAGSAASQELR